MIVSIGGNSIGFTYENTSTFTFTVTSGVTINTTISVSTPGGTVSSSNIPFSPATPQNVPIISTITFSAANNYYVCIGTNLASISQIFLDSYSAGVYTGYANYTAKSTITASSSSGFNISFSVSVTQQSKFYLTTPNGISNVVKLPASSSSTTQSTNPVINSMIYNAAQDYYIVSGFNLFWQFSIYLNGINYSSMSKVTNTQSNTNPAATTSVGTTFNITFNGSVPIGSSFYIICANGTSNTFVITTASYSNTNLPTITNVVANTTSIQSSYTISGTNLTGTFQAYINDLVLPTTVISVLSSISLTLNFTGWIIPAGASLIVENTNGFSNSYTIPGNNNSNTTNTGSVLVPGFSGPTITDITYNVSNSLYSLTGSNFFFPMTVYLNGFSGIATTLNGIPSNTFSNTMTIQFPNLTISGGSSIYLVTAYGNSNTFNLPQSSIGTSSAITISSIALISLSSYGINGSGLTFPCLVFVNSVQYSNVVIKLTSSNYLTVTFINSTLPSGAILYLMNSTGTSNSIAIPI